MPDLYGPWTCHKCGQKGDWGDPCHCIDTPRHPRLPYAYCDLCGCRHQAEPTRLEKANPDADVALYPIATCPRCST